MVVQCDGCGTKIGQAKPILGPSVLLDSVGKKIPVEPEVVWIEFWRLVRASKGGYRDQSIGPTLRLITDDYTNCRNRKCKKVLSIRQEDLEAAYRRAGSRPTMRLWKEARRPTGR